MVELVKDPYYEVGTIDDIVISQSSLGEIDPQRGGSPKKFKNFFVERLDQPSKQMYRGSIFHLYAEDKDKFKVSDAVKPSDKLGLVADAVVSKYEKLQDEQSKLEMMEMIDQHILEACKAIGWNKNYGDTALIKGAAPVATYLRAVNHPDNIGKIILDAGTKVIIENCIESLSANQYAHALLFWKDIFSDIEYYKELDIYWVEYINGEEVKCKAKLDDLVINHEAKTISINDLKTSSKSAYSFMDSFIKWRYDVQFAMYVRAVKANFPQYEGYKFAYRNIVVETTGIFQTVVHRWSQDVVTRADIYLQGLFARTLHAKATNYLMSMEEDEGKGEIRHTYMDVQNSLLWQG